MCYQVMFEMGQDWRGVQKNMDEMELGTTKEALSKVQAEPTLATKHPLVFSLFASFFDDVELTFVNKGRSGSTTAWHG